MASATGIPEAHPTSHGVGEDEPLLGRPGDAAQPEDKGLQFNLVIGTMPIAMMVRAYCIANIVLQALR